MMVPVQTVYLLLSNVLHGSVVELGMIIPSLKLAGNLCPVVEALYPLLCCGSIVLLMITF